jgi:hypothetical protein
VKREDIDGLESSAAADLWRNTLQQVPSVFGRLVYLASLRDAVTGKYEHHGLALRFGAAESAKALRRSHAQTFHEWLGFNLEQQKADLDLYLSAALDQKRAVVANWVAEKAFRNYVPNSVKTVERRLYMADMEALIALLKNDLGVSVPDPNS